MVKAIIRTTKSKRRNLKFHAALMNGKPLCGVGKRILGWQEDFCAGVTCKTCNRMLAKQCHESPTTL